MTSAPRLRPSEDVAVGTGTWAGGSSAAAWTAGAGSLAAAPAGFELPGSSSPATAGARLRRRRWRYPSAGAVAAASRMTISRIVLDAPLDRSLCGRTLAGAAGAVAGIGGGAVTGLALTWGRWGALLCEAAGRRNALSVFRPAMP